MDSFQRLLDFLRRLDDENIAHSLKHVRDEAIMVAVDVPGERWEVEFFADGEVDVEIFRSAGGVLPAEETQAALERLFEVHGG